MKDKYFGVVAMAVIVTACVWQEVAYAKEVTLMGMATIAAFIRD